MGQQRRLDSTQSPSEKEGKEGETEVCRLLAFLFPTFCQEMKFYAIFKI